MAKQQQSKISTLRERLAQPPTHSSWMDLWEHVESWSRFRKYDLEHNYLKQHLSSWPTEICSLPGDHLERWFAGEYHPMYRYIRRCRLLPVVCGEKRPAFDLPALQQLVCLHIDEFDLTREELASLVNSPHLTHLETLTLIGSIPDGDLSKVQMLLQSPSFPALKELDLSGNQLTEEKTRELTGRGAGPLVGQLETLRFTPTQRAEAISTTPHLQAATSTPSPEKTSRTPFALEIAGQTDVGPLRAINEDTYAISQDRRACVVVDGLGGMQAGEDASQFIAMALTAHTCPPCETSLLSPTPPPNTLLQFLLRQALTPELIPLFERPLIRSTRLHRWINRVLTGITSSEHPTYHRMRGVGATVVSLSLQGAQLCISHVGDSRAYRLRAQRLDQLTEDHSLINELLHQELLTPEEAADSPYRNIITRSYGYMTPLELEQQQFEAEHGDLYLLCSDGLHKHASHEQLRERLDQTGNTLEQKAAHLIQLAIEQESTDNITVLLVQVTRLPP